MPYPLRESIRLDGHDLTLYQFSSPAQRQNGGGNVAQDTETNVVMTQGEPLDVSEEPLVLDTFHLGFGYSWRLLQGTYAWAENADARFPRLLLPGPQMTEVTLPSVDGVPRCGMDYFGNFYVGAGTHVYRIPIGSGAPNLDASLGNIAWSMDTFNGSLYVGTSAGATAASNPTALFRNTNGVWTGGGPNRKALAHAWYQSAASGSFGGWQLIASDTPSSVINVAADPMTPANWGASIQVGDSTYPINSLVSDQGHVYVAKTNGLHDVDGTTGFTPNLMPFYEKFIDADNGCQALNANGSIYVCSLAGLFRLDVSGGSTTGRITNVTPGHGLPNETPIRGKVMAMTTYGPWVIASVFNGADSYVMWGRDIRQGDAGTSPFGYGAGYGPSPSAIGPSPMLWHGGLIVLKNEMVKMLSISGLTSPPRLWVGSIGMADNVPHLRWCMIPRTENPMQDVECTFATDWKFHIPGQDWGMPVTTKDLLQIDVQADDLGPNATLDIQVGIDGGPDVDFGQASESPQSTVIGTTDYFGRRLSLTLIGHNPPSTPPVALRAMLPRAQVRPALRRIRTYQVLLGEGNVDRFGGRDITRPIVDYNDLEPLQWGGRVELRDEFARIYQVLVLPPITRKVIYLRGESGKGTAEPVLVATLNVKLLTPDPEVPVTRPPVYWDDGVSRWDNNAYWSAP